MGKMFGLIFGIIAVLLGVAFGSKIIRRTFGPRASENSEQAGVEIVQQPAIQTQVVQQAPRQSSTERVLSQITPIAQTVASLWGSLFGGKTNPDG